MKRPKTLAEGIVDHVADDSVTRAAGEVVARCGDQKIDAVGCRVVHGGERFSEPTVVTPKVLAAIRDLGRLAPLHNPIAAAVLDALSRTLPGIAVVAVFDTAFHRTIPEVAVVRPSAGDGAEKRPAPLRLSRHVAPLRLDTVARQLGRPAAGTRLISCHLGNGASLSPSATARALIRAWGSLRWRAW